MTDDDSLFDFLRAWAWPFDSEDSETTQEGSAFAYWTRDAGFEEGAALVFRFEADHLDLAPDAAMADRRRILTRAEVDALGGPLEAYLSGETDLSTFLNAHPCARAILAVHQEAAAEAAAAAEDDDAVDDNGGVAATS